MRTAKLLLVSILAIQITACAEPRSQAAVVARAVTANKPSAPTTSSNIVDPSQVAQQPVERDWINHLKLRGSISLFTGPSATAHQSFNDLISNAHTSVLMEMFHLTDKAIIQTLEDASHRSVKVDLILDGDNLKKAPGDGIAKALSSSGADVYPSSPKFSITHSKSMVIDHTKAIVSSMNLTDRPEVRRDYGIILEDPGVISEMEKVFAADIDNSKNGTGDTPQVSDPHLLWSPVNSGQKLRDLIDSAKTSIDAVAENVLDQDLLNALIAASKRGVKVRVMSPACSLGQDPHRNYLAAKQLVAAGVDARQMPNPNRPDTPYEHGKMMVIDGFRAYVGSINFSENSEYKARELGIAFEDDAVAGQLSSDFSADFSKSKVPGVRVWNCPNFSSMQ